MMNKKGIFFLMLTLIIISLFILSIAFFSELAVRKSVQKRVETLSEFVNSVEEDLPRQLFIFGYRTIFLMENKIAQEGLYLGAGQFEVLTSEAFFNGTIGGVTQEMLAGSTYDDLVFLLRERAAGIGADVQFANPKINVTQEDPWNVKVVLTADFFAGDQNYLAYWNKTLISVSLISIGNFTDPIYLKEANVDKKIVRNPNQTFGTVASLSNQLENGYYRNYSGAPSFIDRLEGNIGGNYPAMRFSQFGIESLVHLEEDLPQDYTLPAPRSIVDYLFFNDGTHIHCQVGSGSLPSWFRLDNPEHTAVYGVSCS